MAGRPAGQPPGAAPLRTRPRRAARRRRLPSAYRRRSPLGVTAAVTISHACQSKWYCIAISAKRPWHDGPHARLEPPRRARSRCQRGRGAVGAYALDVLFQPRTSRRRTGVEDRDSTFRWRRRRPLEPAPPAQAAPTMVTGSFVSAARGGVSTNWAIARPPGQTKPLRPVIALHGKGSDASTVMAGGVEQGLAQAVNARATAVRGGRRRRRRQLLAQAGLRRGLRRDGPQRADPDAGQPGPGHLAGGVLGLVDGRLRRLAAGRPAGPGPHRGDLRGEPGTVAVLRRGRTRRIRRRRRLRGELGVRNARAGDPSRSGWIAATAIRSTPRPSSSSLSCPTRPRAASHPAGTTAEFWSSQLPAELTWMAPLLTA